MAKEKNHCGIRNGKLFCHNCGGSQMQQLPMAVDAFVAKMNSFAESHKDCPPVWKEPVPDMNAPTQERIKWWAEFGEQGMSAKTIYTVMLMGQNPSSELFTHLHKHDVFVLPIEYSNPHDPDDFNRCHKLLKAMPEWKEHLNKLNFISDAWSRITANWDKLVTMLESKDEEMLGFMKSLGC